MFETQYIISAAYIDIWFSFNIHVVNLKIWLCISVSKHICNFMFTYFMCFVSQWLLESATYSYIIFFNKCLILKNNMFVNAHCQDVKFEVFECVGSYKIMSDGLTWANKYLLFVNLLLFAGITIITFNNQSLLFVNWSETIRIFNAKNTI